MRMGSTLQETPRLAAVLVLLFAGGTAASAQERLFSDTGAVGGLRPTLPATGDGVGLGVVSGLKVLLPALGEGLSHTRRNAVPALTLRGSDMDAPVPDGTSAPALPGLGLAGTTDFDAPDGTVTATVGAALRGSLETRRAEAAARAARANSHAAALSFLPTVTGAIEYGDAPNTARPIGAVARQQSTVASVEANLPIFTSGRLLNQLQQARSLSMAADMNFLAAERKAGLDAALAHVNVRLQRRIVRAVSRHRDALARVATVAKALYRAGEVSRTDVAIARANVEALAADRADAQRRLEDAVATYGSLTGREVPGKLVLPDAGSYAEGSDSLQSVIAAAVADNPTLAAQSHGAQALSHAALAERGRFGPQVSAYANANSALSHSTLPDTGDAYAFGVRLTMPLVAPSAIASVTAAKEEAVAARYGVLEAERVLRRRVAGLWNAREAAARREAAFRRQLAEIGITVKGTLREYEAGFRSITDVLEAQVKELEAQVALEGAIHERASASLRLDFATGRGVSGRATDGGRTQ